MRRIVIALCCLLLTAGCMHSKHLDEYAYAVDIGVERGTTMPYLVTLLVSVPGTGDEQTTAKNVAISAEARTFSEAIETLNAAYPSRLSISRASLLLFSESLAREGGQSAFLDFSFGKPDLWPNLRLAVASGSVKETLEGWTSETDPSLRKIKTSVGELAARSGLSADIGYGAYLECVREGRIDALVAYAGENDWSLKADLVGDDAYPYLGGSLLVSSSLKTTTAGSAVFDGDRMVGVLDGQHTMAVLLVTDAFVSGELLFTMPDEQPLCVRLHRARAPRIVLNGAHATADVYLEADLVSPQTVDMTSDELTAFLSSHLEQLLSRVFAALQRVNSDAMGFGRFAAMRFTSAEAWESFDAKAAYRALTVDFTANVRLSHNPRRPVLE